MIQARTALVLIRHIREQEMTKQPQDYLRWCDERRLDPDDNDVFDAFQAQLTVQSMKPDRYAARHERRPPSDRIDLRVAVGLVIALLLVGMCFGETVAPQFDADPEVDVSMVKRVGAL